MKPCLVAAITLVLIPCAAYAQDQPADPTMQQPSIGDTAKQMGGQLLLSLFNQMVAGKKKAPAPAAEPAPAEEVAVEAEPEALSTPEPVTQQPRSTSALRTVKIRAAK